MTLYRQANPDRTASYNVRKAARNRSDRAAADDQITAQRREVNAAQHRAAREALRMQQEQVDLTSLYHKPAKQWTAEDKVRDGDGIMWLLKMYVSMHL